jgi:hypothetical protein
MSEREFRPTLPYDAEVRQVLRHVGRGAEGAEAGIDHLRAVLDREALAPLPPATLRASGRLVRLIRRASALAERDGSAAVGRAHLRLALAELDAREAGLEPDRLLAARRWVARRYGGRAAQRAHLEGAAEFAQLLQEDTR